MMVGTRVYEGKQLTVLVDEYGLLVRRRWRAPRRIWWEEVRAVEWHLTGSPVLRLTEDTVVLDETLPDLPTLVATVYAASRAARTGLSARLDGETASRLFDLRPWQCLTVTTPPGARREWARAGRVVDVLGPWVMLFLLFFVVVSFYLRNELEPVSLGWRVVIAAAPVPLFKLRSWARQREDPGHWLWELLLGLWARCRRSAAAAWPGVADAEHPRNVSVSEKGVWLGDVCRPWADVRECEVTTPADGRFAVLTLVGGDWRATFPLSQRGARQACRGFRIVADLTRREFIGLDLTPSEDA